MSVGKSRLRKLSFIGFVIPRWIPVFALLFCFGVFGFLFYTKGIFMGEKNYSVRVAAIIDEKMIAGLDPASIKTNYQATLLNNLYSRLFEYDQDGTLKPLLAARYEWREGALRMEVDPSRVLMANGQGLTARDAAVSIRRLLKLKSGTHIKLGHLICDIPTSADVWRDCEGVSVEGSVLILKLRDGAHSGFLIQALASGDLAIVPEAAIDPATLAIKDRTITSGVYSLQTLSGEYILSANPKHPSFAEGSPNRINLVPVGNRRAIDLFKEDKVDIVPTVFTFLQDSHKDLLAAGVKFNIHKTLPLKLYYLRLSLSSLRSKSEEDRLRVGYTLRKRFLDSYTWSYESEPALEFLGALSFGGLNQEQTATLAKLAETHQGQPIASQFSFFIYDILKEKLLPIASIDGVKPIVVPDPVDVSMMPLEERPDITFLGTDTGYEEDISLLGYNFTQGTFGLAGAEADAWMVKYLAEPQVESRRQMVQELIFGALKKGVLFPMMKSPYTALSRNGYTVELSPLFARTQFWRIRKD
jgi:hypothetical protein